MRGTAARPQEARAARLPPLGACAPILLPEQACACDWRRGRRHLQHASAAPRVLCLHAASCACTPVVGRGDAKGVDKEACACVCVGCAGADGGGTCVAADFGVAMDMSRKAKNKLQACFKSEGMLRCSPGYGAPEIVSMKVSSCLCCPPPAS